MYPQTLWVDPDPSDMSTVDCLHEYRRHKQKVLENGGLTMFVVVAAITGSTVPWPMIFYAALIGLASLLYAWESDGKPNMILTIRKIIGDTVFRTQRLFQRKR